MKIKNILASTLIAAIVVGFSIPQVFADPYDLSVNGDGSIMGSYDVETKTFTVTGNGPMEDFKSESNSPFYAIRGEVEHIVISEGITRVGNKTFYSGSKVKDIDLPTTLESIGDSAFRGSTGLTSLTTEEYPNLKTIDKMAFYEFKGFTTVDLDGLSSIGDYAFQGKGSSVDTLTTVTLENIGTIGNYAFAAQTNLDTVSLKTIESLGEYGFSGATYGGSTTNKLVNITVDDVNSIGDRAFSNSSVLSQVTLKNVDTLGSSVFHSCKLLKEINLENVKEIADNMIGSYTKVETVRIGEGTTTIRGTLASTNNSYIKNLYLPSTITSLYDKSKEFFSGLTGVEHFEWNIETPFTAYNYNWFFGNLDSVSTEVLGSRVEGSKTARVHANQIFMIESLKALGYTVETFGELSVDKFATYPTGNVVDMGDAKAYVNPYTGVIDVKGSGTVLATNYPAKLCGRFIKEINFDEGITQISKKGYPSVTFTEVLGSEVGGVVINLPSTLTNLETKAFEKASIKEITLPSGLTNIGSYAFYYVKTLESIEIPASVTSIGQSAFFGMSDLKLVKNYSVSNQEMGKPYNKTFPDLEELHLYSTNTNMLAQTVKMTDPKIVFLDSPATSGTLENGIKWTYYPDSKTIIFEGVGEIPNFEEGYAPWWGAFIQHGHATEWVFKDGITGAGDNIFKIPVGGSDVGGGHWNIWCGGGSSGSFGSSLGGWAPGGSVIGDVGDYTGPGGGGTGGGPGGGDGGDGGDGGEGQNPTDPELPKEETTQIIVDADPTRFKVTVPIAIHITMDTNGNIDTGSGYTVENQCPLGPVLIKNIKVVPSTTWTLTDFNADYANMRANSKNLGLSINGVEVSESGSVSLNSDLSSVIRNQESKALNFEAKLAAQKDAITENVAAVIFTVDFDKI